MFRFYTPWEHQKTKGFLVFSGGIKLGHWPKFGYVFPFLQTSWFGISKEISDIVLRFAIILKHIDFYMSRMLLSDTTSLYRNNKDWISSYQISLITYFCINFIIYVMWETP